MKTEVIDYAKWLSELKTGSRVKTSDCSNHRGCNCEPAYVSSVITMFGEPAIVIVQGCKTAYYSGNSGRELGSRKNAFKQGSIIPFTKEDEEKEKKREYELKLNQRKEELAGELSKLIFGQKGRCVYEFKNILTESDMEGLIKKLR